MVKKNYKEHNEELWNIFSQFSADYQRALITIGELQAENEILKGILKKYNIKITEEPVKNFV